METWEYRVESLVIGSGGIAGWGDFLATLGAEGWDLINDHIFPRTDENGTTILVFGTFKRPMAT
jgi:hypothetical protein